MTKKWTEKDDELIRRLYPTCRLDSLAFRLCVTYCALENLQMMSLYENGLRHLRDETPEKRKERMAKINASRKEHIRRERIRIHFGLEPLGGLVKKW